MTGRWDQKGMPHKGWAYVSVEDREELSEACEMCGTSIRYVHTLSHPEHPNIEVGCVCAEKLCGDYVNPQKNEKTLRRKVANKASRRKNWLKRKWRISGNGNEYINSNGFNIVIVNGWDGWKYSINRQFGRESYETSNEAKLAAFEAYETYKER